MFDKLSKYDLKFIQADNPKKEGDLFDRCEIYKFFAETRNNGNVRYIVRAEFYGDCIAIKFYPQSSIEEYRYKIVYGRFSYIGVLRIILTCASLIPYFINGHYPQHSFVIKASETIDPVTKTEEPENENQRFRIYRNALEKVIGNSIFEHYEFKNVSVYALINKRCEKDKDVESTKKRIMAYLVEKFNMETL